jgi:DnaK suppressor protein
VPPASGAKRTHRKFCAGFPKIREARWLKLVQGYGMKDEQIGWFRARLLEQKRELTSPGDDHSSSLLWQEGDDSQDTADQASRAGGDLVEIRLRNDRANLLRKVDFALQRLADGSYQSCASCGGEIPLERLRAKPSASLCIACQEKKDHAARQEAAHSPV